MTAISSLVGSLRAKYAALESTSVRISLPGGQVLDVAEERKPRDLHRPAETAERRLEAARDLQRGAPADVGDHCIDEAVFEDEVDAVKFALLGGHGSAGFKLEALVCGFEGLDRDLARPGIYRRPFPLGGPAAHEVPAQHLLAGLVQEDDRPRAAMVLPFTIALRQFQSERSRVRPRLSTMFAYFNGVGLGAAGGWDLSSVALTRRLLPRGLPGTGSRARRP